MESAWGGSGFRLDWWHLLKRLPIRTVLPLICLLPVIVRGEPVASAKTTYYEVKGESPRELRHAMNEKRPKAPDGERHDALTLWNITWSYSWKKVDDKFAIYDPKIAVNIGTTLPKWLYPEQPDPEMMARWKSYIKILVAHENDHGKFALQAAKDLERLLTALGPQSSLDELKRLVDVTGQQVLTDCRTRNVKYDVDTDHGHRQGALFP